ncbi:hypothetical protein, partial [Thauera sinica]
LADHDPQLTGMASQLVGAVSSAISGGDPNLASDIALSDTQYNHELHKDAAKVAEQALEHCKSRPEQCDPSFARLTTGDVLAAMEAEAQHGVGFENAKPEALAFVNNYMFALSPGLKDFLYVPTESEQQRLDTVEKAELTLAGASLVGGLVGAAKSSGTISSWIANLVGKSGANAVVGLADDAATFALSNIGRVDHSARHLIDAGVITANSGSKAARQAFQEIGQSILTNPTRTFDHVMAQGGQAVKGYYGTVNGSDVVIFVAKEAYGKIKAGDIVTAIKPSAQQMKNFGL